MNIDLIKEKIQKLKIIIENISERWDILKYENKIEELNKIKNQENFWQNPNQTEILKESKKYENIKIKLQKSLIAQKNIEEILSLYENHDESLINEITIELTEHEKNTNSISVILLMNQEDDNKPCFIDINAGAGGTEAQDWAEMLLRMYMRFFEKNNLKFSIIDYLNGEGAGIKSATIFIDGDYPMGLMASEVGVHRLVRISPFDSNQRRHTSFASISATPEAPAINIVINDDDLRIDTYRAGGAGGQHVNKTDSAVRITHLPTNIVVQCQNERSQNQNKETAMKMLKAKLYQKEKEEMLAKIQGIEKKKIEWGSQIRSYVLHPYKMVKDHRTELESAQPEKILDGEILEFIEKYLIIRK